MCTNCVIGIAVLQYLIQISSRLSSNKIHYLTKYRIPISQQGIQFSTCQMLDIDFAV